MRRRPAPPANMPPAELLTRPATAGELDRWHDARLAWQAERGWPAVGPYPAGLVGRLQGEIDARLVLAGSRPVDRRARRISAEARSRTDDDDRT